MSKTRRGVLSYASVRHYEWVCVSGAVSDTGDEHGMRAASSLSIVNRHGVRTYERLSEHGSLWRTWVLVNLTNV